MHSMIVGGLVLLAATLVAACANPTSPSRQLAHDPTVVAALARQRPTAPVSAPDSVGIPPSIPPIFEEMPAALDGTQ